MEIKKFVDFIKIIEENNINEIAVDIDGVFLDTNAAIVSCGLQDKINPFERIGKIENLSDKDLDFLLNVISWNEFVNLRLYLYLLTITEDYPEIKLKFITSRYGEFGKTVKDRIETLFPTVELEVLTDLSTEDKKELATDNTLIIDDNIEVIENVKNKITVKTPWTEEFISKTNCSYFNFWKLGNKQSSTSNTQTGE